MIVKDFEDRPFNEGSPLSNPNDNGIREYFPGLIPANPLQQAMQKKQFLNYEAIISKEAAATPRTRKQSVVYPTNYLHVCFHCGLVFNNPSNLEVHTQYHCKKRPFCDITNKDNSKDKPNLDASDALDKQKAVHLRQNTFGATSVLNDGNICLTNSKDILHRDSLTESPRRQYSPPLTGAFRCQMCSFTADKQSRLVEHMSAEHPEDQEETNSSHSSKLEGNCYSENLQQGKQKQHQVTKEATESNSMKTRSDIDSNTPLPQGKWHCEQCDIRFTSRCNFLAHKEHYCGTRMRKKGTCVPPTEPLPNGSLINSGVPNTLHKSIPNMLPHVMPIPPGFIVPMLTPYGVTYGLPYLFQTPLAHNIAHEKTSHQAEATKHQIKNEDQPLDLSCKKKEHCTENKHEVEEKIRRTSDPGFYGERKSSWPKPSGRWRKHSLGQRGASYGSLNPLMIPNLTGDVHKCEECDIVFYKQENFKVHKEMYCVGRRSKDNITKRSDLKSPPSSTTPLSSPPSPDRTFSNGNLVNNLGSTSNENSRDTRTPEEYTMQYMCIPCKIKFSSLDTLEAHQQYYCPTSKAIAEQVKSKVFKSISTKEAGDNEPGSCANCAIFFASKAELSNHICTHTTMKIPMFCCPYCEYVAQSDSRLLDHIKAHAPTKAYRCEICGYRGNTVRGMRMHGKSHLDAGENFTDDHMIEYDEPPLIPKRLRTVTESVEIKMPTELLRKRSRAKSTTKMNGEKPYKRIAYLTCPICHTSVEDNVDMQTHLSLHLQRYGGFSCTLCKFTTEIQELLIKHVADMHHVNKGKANKEDAKSPTNYNIENILKIKTNSRKRSANSPIAYDTDFEANSSDEENKILPKKCRKNKTTVCLPAQSKSSTNKEDDQESCEGNEKLRKISSNETIHYCKQCDIPFVYLATYLAHKKYYCSSHAKERGVDISTEI